MKWIKCSEQLPEIGKEVLVSDGHKVRSTFRESMRKGKSYWFDCCNSCLGMEEGDIEFWAELPDGPYAEYIKPIRYGENNEQAS